MQTACVNFTELRFTSDAAMRRYLADIESIWTPDIMQQMAKLGLERKSITRIWNQPNQFKLGILWEYSSPEAFKNCQKLIARHILPHAHKYEMVARSLRGVPIVDWRSDASGFTKSNEVLHGAEQKDYLASEEDASTKE
ncbi:MAG: DUF6974 family protein [Candidatus Puniceispirillaceae bacterium]